LELRRPDSASVPAEDTRAIRGVLLGLPNSLRTGSTSRPAGYLAFAVFARETGRRIRASPRAGLVSGAIDAVLACLLVLYGFSPQKSIGAAKVVGSRFQPLTSRRPEGLCARH